MDAHTVRAPLAILLVAGCRASVGAPLSEPATPPIAVEPAVPGELVLPEPGTELRDPAERAPVDVLHYDLEIDLLELDESRISAVATLTLRSTAVEVPLDFVGLTVDSVRSGGRHVPFRHDGAVLRLALDRGEHEVAIHYGGKPRNGLFFEPDGQGDPTAFADNWPNRARWWFPANDHPSDKATVEFELAVPASPESSNTAIANGVLERVDLRSDRRAWLIRWASDVPIPTYTMVIGVARFQRAVIGQAACGDAPAAAFGRDCASVWIWTLPGDSAYGVERFARAPDMVDYYTELIGAYPYEKLAHVESSTRFGGMENSSAIFYARGGWEGRRMGEGVIAHETAHQWFGDAVTPADWHHLWVSEGFASYFGPLYFADRDGEEALRERLEAARQAILASNATERPVVDPTTNDLFSLLNTNSYQKGAWFLHMTRGLMGDEAFFAAIRTYYETHEHGVATTADVRRAFEAHHEGEDADMRSWFDQWLYRPGYPQLEVEWAVESAGATRDELSLAVDIRQTQPAEWPTFTFPLWFEAELEDGRVQKYIVVIKDRSRSFSYDVPGPVRALRIDPDGWLLKTLELRSR